MQRHNLRVGSFRLCAQGRQKGQMALKKGLLGRRLGRHRILLGCRRVEACGEDRSVRCSGGGRCPLVARLPPHVRVGGGHSGGRLRGCLPDGPGRRRGALFVLFRTDGDGLGPVAASVDNHVGGGPSGPRRCLPPRGPQRREQRRRWKWRPPPRPQRLPAAPAGCPRRQPLPRGRPKQLPPRPGRRPRRRAARLR